MKEYKELERQLKALANSRRLAIIKFLLKNKKAKVGEVADAIKLSFKSTSRHLVLLANAGIIDSEKRSLEVHYRVAAPPPSVASKVISSM